jgi:hypothetical protein
MHIPAQLVSQVMALPPDARAELLVLIQDSLPVTESPGLTGSEEQLAAEWTEELDRRIANSRSGESPDVDADTALAMIRKHVAAGQGVRRA